MEETWKDILGYEGMYQVSNMGRVKNLRAKEPKILLIKPSKLGYNRIGMMVNKKREMVLVHRLVAINFIPNPNNYSMVNHKNGIKSDNRVDNLEWVSHRENISHSYLSKDTASKYAGVTFDKIAKVKKWKANIHLNGKRVSLGRRETEYEAHLLYLEALDRFSVKNKYSDYEKN